MKFLLFWILTTISFVSSAPTVLTPSEDDFYQPPPGYESATVGSVLKIRNTPNQLRSIYFPMNVKNSWQILFKTETALGNDSYTVATLVEPYNSNSSKLVTYNAAEDSADISCSVSYAIMYGASMETVITQAEGFLWSMALELGYWVLLTDYEGSTSSLSIGLSSGKNVLNGIRLAINSANQTGLDPNFETVLWGYSGGSLASIWAASLQPEYAPELKPRMLGAAVGGLITNITSSLVAIDGTLFSGFSFISLKGLANEYPYLRNIIKQSIDPVRWSYFDLVGSKCMVKAISYSIYTPIFQGPDRWFPGGLGFFDIPEIHEAMANNTLGIRKNEMPEIPLFVFNGLNDTIVPYSENTEKIYDLWCEWGIESMEVSTSETTGHLGELFLGQPAAFAWINDRFNHVPPIKGCLKTNRYSNLFYPGALTEVLTLVGVSTKAIYGSEIGPNSKREEAFYEERFESSLQKEDKRAIGKQHRQVTT